MSKRQIRNLVYVSFCGALVILLAKFTRFPPFPWAPYLKLEFGEIPLLLLLMFGSLSMALEALVLKELLSFLFWGTHIFGLASDFAACAVFLVAFSLSWQKTRAWDSGLRRILWAALIGTAARVLAAIPINLVILPLQTGTPVAGVWAQMVYLLPFNALKCLLDLVCVLLLHPRVKSPLTKVFSDL